MRNIIILLIFAACGYAAYAHLEAQEKRIAKADASRQKAVTEKTELTLKITALTESIKETSRRLEQEKTKALEQIKADMEADFIRRKSEIETEIKTLQESPEINAGDPPKEIAEKIASINAEMARMNASYKKMQATNESLARYVKAEEEAQNKIRRSPRSYPYNEPRIIVIP